MIRLIRKNNDQILNFLVKLIQVILLDKKSEAENTPKGALTSVTAPAHPYATDAVVYTALFFDVFAFLPFALFCFWPFLPFLPLSSFAFFFPSAVCALCHFLPFCPLPFFALVAFFAFLPFAVFGFFALLAFFAPWAVFGLLPSWAFLAVFFPFLAFLPRHQRKHYFARLLNNLQKSSNLQTNLTL